MAPEGKGAPGRRSASLSGFTAAGRTLADPTLVGVGVAAKERREANVRFAEAIWAANEAGQSLRQIASAAGISHTRVYQILREKVRE